jgi:hypothetical protein
MNQRLSDWASVAEIVSALAVVITLIFLLAGIRENTAAVQASMFDRNIDSLNEIRKTVYSDSEVARLWQAYRNGDIDSLDEINQIQAVHLASAVLTIYEKAYYANENNLIGPDEWERFEFQICNQLGRIESSASLKEMMEGALTPKFRSYVQGLCRA